MGQGMFDIHHHLLPGLDDGPLDWEQSMAMAQEAVADGIAEVVCTPHWMPGQFENNRSQVLTAVKKLQEKLNDCDIPLRVYPGAELRLDPHLPQNIESGDLITLNDTGRFALIELPDPLVPQDVDRIFGELLTRTITPVIGHPERNHALQRDPTLLYQWVEMGALAQVTAGSVTGRFGAHIRRFTLLLLEHRLVHLLATDAHSPNIRAPKLSEALVEVGEIVGEEDAVRMVKDTPRLIIGGEPVPFLRPIPLTDVSKVSSFLKKSFYFLKFTASGRE